MIQFYLLAVVINVLGALFLIYGKDLTLKEDADTSSASKKILGLDDELVRFVCGIIAAFTGLIKLLSPYSGIILLGDLIPSAACFSLGASLLIEYYICKTSSENVPENIQGIFLSSRKIIGYACLGSAILHFIMPQVPLL